jgi:hypothetical protein
MIAKDRLLSKKIVFFALSIATLSCGEVDSNRFDIDQRLQELQSRPFDVFYEPWLESLQTPQQELTYEEALLVVRRKTVEAIPLHKNFKLLNKCEMELAAIYLEAEENREKNKQPGSYITRFSSETCYDIHEESSIIQASIFISYSDLCTENNMVYYDPLSDLTRRCILQTSQGLEGSPFAIAITRVKEFTNSSGEAILVIDQLLHDGGDGSVRCFAGSEEGRCRIKKAQYKYNRSQESEYISLYEARVSSRLLGLGVVPSGRSVGIDDFNPLPTSKFGEDLGDAFYKDSSGVNARASFSDW